jgi:thymidylate synthase
MYDIRSHTLGQAWLAALRETCLSGEAVADETLEVRDVRVAFEQASAADPLLVRFAESAHIDEMRKVFFSAEANRFGHSYLHGMRGPEGRNDLLDVIALLRREPLTKRGVLTLVGDANKVPCVNVVHFLLRGGRLTTTYFARGQDIYKKFYADALCIHDMLARVAGAIGVPPGGVAGFISSAHVYTADLPRARRLLEEAAQSSRPELQTSGGAL